MLENILNTLAETDLLSYFYVIFVKVFDILIIAPS